MDNEKKYNELVGKIKRAYLYAQTGSTKAVLEDILPELKEGKDEKIRKAIRGWIYTRPSQFFDGGFSKEEMLAWLEKQGEQILANSAKTGKDETKFHKGQWIVWQEKCYKVNYNGCGYELVDQNGLITSLEYGTVDKNAHIWDITKDARVGDVLASKDKSNILIFRNLDTSTSFSSYYNTAGKGELGWSNECFIPATKEQCDLLFQKMKEEGYEWDAEKKELKKIEQKPTWSEEDEEEFQIAIDTLVIAGQHDSADWLKSLKERCTWKPSDEQIKAIRLARSFVVDDFGEHPTLSEILMELEEQLQKIKEGQTKNR